MYLADCVEACLVIKRYVKKGSNDNVSVKG